MNIHILEHVAHEDAGSILDWANSKSFTISKTALYENFRFPDLNNIDMLVIMGGPMNIYEEAAYPWLANEKKFIRQTINLNKYVLGICLGAQLIADVLGAKISTNKFKEIGWHPIRWTATALRHKLLNDFMPEMTVFHWHGDTFETPDGAIRLAESKACQNQGFLYQERVLGLQFHLEAKESSIRDFITHGQSELVASPFIQTENEVLSKMNNVPTINKAMSILLDRFVI